MTRSDFAARIAEDYDPGVVLLDPPELDRAIVGFTAVGPARAVYTYDGLLEAFAAILADEPDPEAAAREWIEYNTLRSIPHMGEHAPVVVGTPDWLQPETRES